MDERELQAAWAGLDRSYLAEVARRGPPPLFASVSGAHLYGFASPDSDVDLRGAFVRPLRDVLGLTPSPETITLTEPHPLDLDYVAHDVQKVARMLVTANGYVLEQLFSPLLVVETEALHTLRALARGTLTRSLSRHYRGFLRGRMARLREPAPTVKHLLYAYRIALAGLHLARTGEVCSHLPTLLAATDVRELSRVTRAMAIKRAGSEAEALGSAELEGALAELRGLDDALAAAFASSALPETIASTAALEDFVVRVRVEGLR